MKRRVSAKSKWMIISSFAVSAALIVTLIVNMTVGTWETDLVFVIGSSRLQPRYSQERS